MKCHSLSNHIRRALRSAFISRQFNYHNRHVISMLISCSRNLTINDIINEYLIITLQLKLITKSMSQLHRVMSH